MIVAAALVVVAAIIGATYVGVVAVNAQRDTLTRMTTVLADQARRDADERHVLVDRVQHPEIARPFRTPPPPPEPQVQRAGTGLAGEDVSHLSDAEIEAEFGKDILDALS